MNHRARLSPALTREAVEGIVPAMPCTLRFAASHLGLEAYEGRPPQAPPRRTGRAPHASGHWLGLCLSLVALVFASGSQWMMLQGVAWARMIVVYSQEGSILEAVSQTFSGRRPCALCHVAQKGQQEQNEQAPWQGPSTPLELIPVTPAARVAALECVLDWPRSGEPRPPESPAFSPPKPPPRAG